VPGEDCWWGASCFDCSTDDIGVAKEGETDGVVGGTGGVVRDLGR
jgi:hypothetical protein